MNGKEFRNFLAQMSEFCGGSIPNLPRRRGSKSATSTFEFTDHATKHVYRVTSAVTAPSDKPHEIEYKLTITFPNGDEVVISRSEQIPGVIDRIREEISGGVWVEQDIKSATPLTFPKGPRVLA